MHIKSWGTKKAEHMMIHYERINYPLNSFSFPLWFLPDLLWTVLTGHRHAETGRESQSLWSSLLWSGNMIRLPSGSLFWGAFWEISGPSLKKASSQFWPTFHFFLLSSNGLCGHSFYTSANWRNQDGETLIPSKLHNFFFLWQRYKDNHSRSLSL